ncbi:DNA replication and repair protein RecN [Thermovibrio guaymasensis]|uniref:DNA repair protein RecN n=1 Tax=Thermovibrio guaymasensis TaxID=240167 RepID=A0A420W7C9_9BACT|nr:chromosome segregation protein SMC [Thermovibrio guaymasensis]RKQ63230.1 DNA replication and repair protein RecN [Thermovibrio guaymasensis]
MLEELRLFNFGSITGELLFSPGFNVIIGETGTGKSLLLSSINFLKGDRSSISGEGTFVEALFRVGDEEVSVRREIKSSRSRFFLNGMRVPQKRVEEVVSPLILFQSQRLSAEFLKPSYQLSLIDEVSGNREILARYRELYQRYVSSLRELEALRDELSAREREIDVLKFQISEIEEANIGEGEEEELLELKKLVSRAQELEELRRKSLYLLYEGESSALSLISEVLREFEKVSLFPEIREKLEELYYSLEGLVSEIDSKIEPPQTEMSLSEIEERLYQIERIKRKYGPTLSDVSSFLSRAKERLEFLERGDEKLEEKEREVEGLKKELLEVAREISRRRREGAEKLKELLEEEFKDLGLLEARFEVEFISLEEPSPSGLERVRFLFSGNPKLPLSPLSQSISGGELSRFLLSVLKILSPENIVMVFDEVDSGISGKILRKVAEKLREISRRVQVIAVSHWPQVVAAADRVFKLEKGAQGEVKVRLLQGEDLLRELSIMISGQVSAGGLKAAKDLLMSWEERWHTERENTKL